ncbi:MAG: HK97 family phage prohead protease [Pseudomonadota bacterium]
MKNLKISPAVLRFKFASGAPEGTIIGYGSVAGVRDSYGDVVLPGAFADSLEHREPRMLWQHDQREPIGKWTSITEDEHGLAVEGQLNLDVQRGREALALLKQDSAMLGLSIGYSIPSGGEEFDRDSGLNLLKTVELWEVSLVTFPANDQAVLSQVKSGGPRHFERHLRRSIGLSARETKRFMADGWRGLSGNDCHAEDLERLATVSVERIKKLDQTVARI